MRKIILFLALCMCTSGVWAAKAQAPSWILSPASAYSEDFYVSAVGTGTDAEKAEKNAKENLASIFSLSVSGETTVLSSETRVGSGNDASSVYSDSLDSMVSISLAKTELLGVKIQQKYQEGNTYYALAVMHKATAIDLYRARVDKEVPIVLKEYYAVVDDQSVSLQKLKKVTELLSDLTPVASDLAILKYLSVDAVRRYSHVPSVAEIRAMQNELLSSIEFSIAVRGDVDSRIENALYDLISSKGFYVAFGEARYEMQVVANIASTTVGTNVNKFYKYQVSINVRDTVDKQNVLSFTISGREGSKTDAAAKSRTMAIIEKRIATEFGTAFDDGFLN